MVHVMSQDSRRLNCVIVTELSERPTSAHSTHHHPVVNDRPTMDNTMFMAKLTDKIINYMRKHTD